MTVATKTRQGRRSVVLSVLSRGPQISALLPLLLSLLLTACCILCVSCDRARTPTEFPSRPIRVIVPFSPGGGSDTLARVFKKAIDDAKLLDVPFVIINVDGAGGTIGSRRVKNAAADGHTILFLHQAILTAKHSGRAAYGQEAFEPIAATGESLMVVATADESSIVDLASVIERARQSPDSVAFGANLGAPSHFVARQLEAAVDGAAFRFVQTGGGAKRFAALEGGHIDLTVFSVDELVRFRPAGVRPLALLSATRHASLPDVPTAREQGIDVVSSNLNFWWAPKGTPHERIALLGDVFRRAIESDYVREKLRAAHCDAVFLSGDALRSRLNELDAELSKAAREEPQPLPNLPRIVLVITALLFVGVVWRSRRGRDRTSPTRTEPPRRRLGLPLRFAGLVVVYVSILGLVDVRFAIPTAVFVFTSIVILGEGRRSIYRSAVVAILFATALHLVFSSVFSIALP